MQTLIHDPHLDTTGDSDGNGGSDDGNGLPGGGRRPRPAAQRVLVVVLVLAVLAAGAVIGLLSSGGDESSSSRQAAAPTTDPSTTAEQATDAPADQAPAPSAPAPGNGTGAGTGSEDVASLEDGRHPVYLTGIDASAGTVEFDLIQWLTDDAAVDYVEAHEDEYPGLYDQIEETGTYPYDELVVNESPRLRTLPVAPDTQPMVLMQPDGSFVPRSIDFAELPAYFDESPQHDGDISYFVFWLTVRDGEIVAMEEQFQS